MILPQKLINSPANQLGPFEAGFFNQVVQRLQLFLGEMYISSFHTNIIHTFNTPCKLKPRLWALKPSRGNSIRL